MIKKKLNKHRAAKRKAMRTSQRTSEVMKKIAPGLHENRDSRCEKSHILKKLVFKLNNRKKKWLEFVVCQHDTTGLSDARDYLSSLLRKNGGNTGTSTSSYHGDCSCER